MTPEALLSNTDLELLQTVLLFSRAEFSIPLVLGIAAFIAYKIIKKKRLSAKPDSQSSDGSEYETVSFKARKSNTEKVVKSKTDEQKASNIKDMLD